MSSQICIEWQIWRFPLIEPNHIWMHFCNVTMLWGLSQKKWSRMQQQCETTVSSCAHKPFFKCLDHLQLVTTNDEHMGHFVKWKTHTEKCLCQKSAQTHHRIVTMCQSKWDSNICQMGQHCQRSPNWCKFSVWCNNCSCIVFILWSYGVKEKCPTWCGLSNIHLVHCECFDWWQKWSKLCQLGIFKFLRLAWKFPPWLQLQSWLWQMKWKQLLIMNLIAGLSCVTMQKRSGTLPQIVEMGCRQPVTHRSLTGHLPATCWPLKPTVSGGSRQKMTLLVHNF